MRPTAASAVSSAYCVAVCGGLRQMFISESAHGVPVGGELDYLDEGTLAAAIKQRTLF